MLVEKGVAKTISHGKKKNTKFKIKNVSINIKLKLKSRNNMNIYIYGTHMFVYLYHKHRKYKKKVRKSMATSKADEVFIDFSGIETRNSFVSHLSAAFRRRSVSVCLGGDCTDVVTPRKTNEGCKVFVVVFSEDYALSKQCLDTLVEFLERKDDGLVIVPVYYGGVTESMVKQQTERFGVAFTQHQNNYSYDQVAKWRDCLIQTASLPGHELNLQQE